MEERARRRDARSAKVSAHNNKYHLKHTSGATTSGDKVSYYLYHGMRHCLPYHFTYCINAKKRWFAMSLLAVLKREFKAQDMNRYFVTDTHTHTHTHTNTHTEAGRHTDMRINILTVFAH